MRSTTAVRRPTRQGHAEVTSPAAVARLKHRPDVVRHRGRYALINATRTPYQAMVEDLLFIRNVLADAGLDYLLVRGNNHRPVIALDWKDRKKLRAALVEACRNEPVLLHDRGRQEEVLGPGGRRRALPQPQRPDLPAVPSPRGARRRLRVRLVRRRADRAVELRGQPADPADRKLPDPPDHARAGRRARHRGTLRPHLAHHREHVRGPCQRHQLRHRHGVFLGGWQLPGVHRGAARPDGGRRGGRGR